MSASIRFYAILIIFFPYLAISQDFNTFENQVFQPNIKTILLFPDNDPRQSAVFPPAAPINYTHGLVLKFDEINVDEAFTYNAKIIHCDANWQKSSLHEMEYLYDYNEFNIDRYEFSSNRVIHYTHYTFPVPKVKIPGNYVIVVYKNFDEDNVVFTRRFYVYDRKIGINSKKSIIGSAVNKGNQMIEFTIDYSSYPVLNPLQEIKVVVRQNGRWDNALTELKPTLFRADLKQMVFRNYNLSEAFKAGNEFRFFDLTSVRYSMRNVDRITESDQRVDAYLMRDKFRGYEPYSMTMNADLNGGFYIENKDFGNHHIDSEYIYTHFFLEAPPGIRDDIYIGGKLTGWKISEANKLKYVEETQMYTGSLLLKQGFYDYQYLVPGYKENPNIIEGNHFETSNFYEILIYYHHPTFRTDVLLGYLSFTSN